MSTQYVKRCAYWSCTAPIHPNETFCIQHYWPYKEGFLDKCPKCRRYKSKEYKYCQDCQFNLPVVSPNNHLSLEHSEAWQKGDINAERFYVYVLKLDRGDFYVGHTRELRERLTEHRDGRAKTTAGRNPRLAYFEVLSSRESVAMREAELKRIKEANPRELRRLVIRFQDLVREVELD